jgi:hypothetical protein
MWSRGGEHLRRAQGDTDLHVGANLIVWQALAAPCNIRYLLTVAVVDGSTGFFDDERRAGRVFGDSPCTCCRSRSGGGFGLSEDHGCCDRTCDAKDCALEFHRFVWVNSDLLVFF